MDKLASACIQNKFGHIEVPSISTFFLMSRSYMNISYQLFAKLITHQPKTLHTYAKHVS